MAMATESERIACIEGAYEHLATRADVQEVRFELQVEIQAVRSELKSDIDVMT